MAARPSQGDQRVGVVKAHVLKPADRPSIVEALFGTTEDEIAGLIPLPIDTAVLVKLWEMSSSLPANVAAMVTNVDSFGHRYEPAIDLDAPDANARIREALVVERLHDALVAQTRTDAASEAVPGVDPTSLLPDPADRLDQLANLPVVEPTTEDVAKRAVALRRVARLELARLRSFFEFCCPGSSFVTLRRRLRLDLEITGNAAVEVLRDRSGIPARLVRLPILELRLAPVDAEPTRIEELVRTSDLTWERVAQHRFFRRYAQVASTKQVVAWFREFGDPRVISSGSGKVYDSEASLQRTEPDAKVATEVVHFSIAHPGSAWGLPRWIGNSPAVLGSRELDETNLDYFRSNSVPPLAIMVSGGSFKKNVVSNLETFFDQKVRGRGSTHKVVILEAEPVRTGGVVGPVPKIEFVPLRDAQQQDALFQVYDERNADKICSSFRLPRILTGRDRATNRATAQASLQFAEDQVFAGERNEFDELVNRRLLPELGITFWRFKSNSPTTHDPETLGAVITSLVETGVLSQNEARGLVSGLFNQAFPAWETPEANQPLPIVLANLRSRGDLPPARATRSPRRAGPSVEQNPATELEDPAPPPPANPTNGIRARRLPARRALATSSRSEVE